MCHVVVTFAGGLAQTEHEAESSQGVGDYKNDDDLLSLGCAIERRATSTVARPVAPAVTQ